VVKNLPYTKHFDINSNAVNTNNPYNNKNLKNEADKKPDFNNPAAALNNRSSIYNINNIFSNEPSNKGNKNSQNDLIKLDHFIINSTNNNNKSNNNINKFSQPNKNKNKNEEKINTVDSSNKKPAYGSNKAKEDFKEKSSAYKNTNNVVIKNGNIKGSK